MLLTHLGHACLLVEAADTRVLVDPGVFSPDTDGLSGLAAVVITHQHVDHVDLDRLPGLLAANPDAVVAADPETAAILAEREIATAVVLVAGAPISVGAVTLEPVGDLHAVNHSGVPRCTNVGVVVRASGEPVLYHPGDAYDGEPGPVDVLAMPLSAPWCRISESIDFVRRVAPSIITPIHQALLSEVGLGLYTSHITTYGGDDLTLLDLSDGLAHEV